MPMSAIPIVAEVDHDEPVARLTKEHKMAADTKNVFGLRILSPKTIRVGMMPLTIHAPAKAPTISRIKMALVESDIVVSIPFQRSFLRFLGVKRAAIPAEANRISWLLPSRLLSPYN